MAGLTSDSENLKTVALSERKQARQIPCPVIPFLRSLEMESQCVMGQSGGGAACKGQMELWDCKNIGPLTARSHSTALLELMHLLYANLFQTLHSGSEFLTTT